MKIKTDDELFERLEQLCKLKSVFKVLNKKDQAEFDKIVETLEKNGNAICFIKC